MSVTTLVYGLSVCLNAHLCLYVRPFLHEEASRSFVHTLMYR